MVRGLHALIASVAGHAIPSGSPNLSDAHVLAVKVLKHVVTARHLMRTHMHVIDDTYPFVDHASVSVLARTAIEGCLALHYTFCHPDAETRAFRHKIWRYSGLLERSKITVPTGTQKERWTSAIKRMAQLRAELTAHRNFQALPRKIQKNVLDGNWRPQAPWIDIAEGIGISRRLFHQQYDHFCGQCHSSFISVLQTRDAMNDHGAQAQLALVPSAFLAIILAHTIDAYRHVLPPAQAAFEADAEIKEWVQRVHRVAAALGALLDQQAHEDTEEAT